MDGMKLADYLIEHGLTPVAFARKAGIHRMNIHRWISGERRPNVDMMARIKTATEGRVTAKDFDAPEESDTENDGLFPWSRLSPEEEQEIQEAYVAMLAEPLEGVGITGALRVALDTLGDRVTKDRHSPSGYRLDGRPASLPQLVIHANRVLRLEGKTAIAYPGVRDEDDK
ncbi:MAG: helix-turn-helix transcriptional regulator [Planctomycetota bacterium]